MAIFARILWIGLFCCIGALLVRMFPNAAFEIGVDMPRAWLLFGFGLFLIVAGLRR